MQAELIAYTQANPALSPQAVAGMGDLSAMRQGRGTFAENLIEYAGRVCYRSTNRMGAAADFIADRVREGHEDIIEHVVASVRLRCLPDEIAAAGDAGNPATWRLHNRHCEVSDLGDGDWLVSGNTRVWLDFFRQGFALPALPLLRAIAPGVFDVLPLPASAVPAQVNTPTGLDDVGDLADLLPSEDGPMRVTLLGYTRPLREDPGLRLDTDLLLNHGSATFFFEGISRTCTHQLVRHRLASFSQESQRYVDLSKGDWRAIVPPAIAANPAALAELEEFWRMAEEKYARLRQLGIRKEDARFLLPNAAETRIITTMNFAAWSHFLWLRAVDKAAQWEIRLMGVRTLEMLHAIAPAVFEPQWRVYQEQFRGEGRR